MAFNQMVRLARIRWTPFTLFTKQLQRKSTLSSSFASELRSFYLSVHPDFFAQHPRIQKVNESSLKRLNNYLEAVQCSRQVKNLQPTRVSFYFRKEKDEKSHDSVDFKLVQFTLQSHDLKTNLEHILKSCDLPSKHLSEVGRSTSSQKKRESDSFQGRYKHTHYRQEAFYRDEQEYETDNNLNLRQWLSKYSVEGKNQQESSRLIRQSNETLKEDLCMQLGLREIVWCSPWQHTSQQGTLRNFARACSQNKDHLRCLQGSRLVFTDRTMVGADESICLNVEDVTQHWLQFLSRLDERYHEKCFQARRLDDYVHKKCGNIKIIRPKVRTSRFREHATVSIEEYISVLNKIVTRLKNLEESDDGNILPWSMRNLEITFVQLQDPGESTISMFSNGRLCVDKNCEAADFLNYLTANKNLAQEKKYIHANDEARVRHLTELCMEKLGFASLTKEFDVEQHQMISCLERLLQNSVLFNIYVSGLEIRITAKYFSVFDHGCLCIAWDWKQ